MKMHPMKTTGLFMEPKNMSFENINDETGTKKNLPSLDELVERLVYETIREDVKEKHPTDSAA
jgi:hypothetical protein